MTTVRAVMQPCPASVRADDSVRSAAALMRGTGAASLPVCDASGDLLAEVSEHDVVVRCVALGLDPGATTVARIIDGPAVGVDAEQGLEQALAGMIEHAVRRLPVTDAGRLVGLVTQSALTDLLPPRVVRRVVARATTA